MKKTTTVCIISLLVFLSLVTGSSAQNNKTYTLRSEAGFVLITDMSYFGDYEIAPYLAPSMRIKRHEFYIGFLIGYPFGNGPNMGGLAGYRFYFFNESSRLNMFLHYDFKYFPDFYIQRPSNVQCKFNHYNNSFGYGFNVSIDKKNKISFFTTLGYNLMIQQLGAPSSISYEYYWKMMDITAGLSIKLGSFANESKEINK